MKDLPLHQGRHVIKDELHPQTVSNERLSELIEQTRDFETDYIASQEILAIALELQRRRAGQATHPVG